MNPSKQKRKSHQPVSAIYLNMEYLLTMAQGDQSALAALIQKAVGSLEESLESLTRSFRTNPVVFRRELHKLKGSLGIIEPHILHPVCRELDKNFLTLTEDERDERSRFLMQGLSFLLQELKGVSTNEAKLPEEF